METVGVPARRQAVREMTDHLRMMEAGGDGAAVLEKLRGLRQLAEDMAAGWMRNPDTDGFYFYYAASNVVLLLDGIRERLAGGGDPEAARDALAVMPAIDGTLGAAEAGEISKESVRSVIDMNGAMLDAAVDARLDGPLDRDAENVDWGMLEENMAPLVKCLGMRTKEGYTPDD